MIKYTLVILTILLVAFSKDKVEGIASYYANRFEGRKTASGEPYRKDQLTAASNLFPLHTVVEVRDKMTDNSVVVRINDRIGHPTRVIDLSLAAAKKLDIINKGLTTVIIKKL